MEIIKVNNLGIKFEMGKRTITKTRHYFMGWFRNMRNSSSEFWALRQVTFSVNRGDTIGIIGKNGSCKSTLLRVIAGIYPPDEGEVFIHGELSTLFSLGAGFQPELSGRENIFLKKLEEGKVLWVMHIAQ